MEDNEKDQGTEPVQEQEPLQEPGLEQELSPNQKDKQNKDDKEEYGLLLPVLYALLAAIGVFTLIMLIGIGIAFFTNRAPAPSEQPSQGITEQTSQEVTEQPS